MTKTLVLVGVTVLTAIVAQFLLKAGVNRHGAIDGLSLAMVARVAREPLVLAGVVFYAASGLSWLIALSRVDLSLAYPLLSLAVVGVAVGSPVLLHEPVSLSRVAGTALTLAGVWLIVRSG